MVDTATWEYVWIGRMVLVYGWKMQTRTLWAPESLQRLRLSVLETEFDRTLTKITRVTKDTRQQHSREQSERS